MIWHIIHKWHMKIGIVAALFVFLLASTGIMLNHTNTLGIDNLYVKNQVLLDIYNIGPLHEPKGFMVGEHWVIKIGDRIYFDRKELMENSTALTGAISTGDYIVISLEDYILLVTPAGEILERLTQSEGVPPGIQSIGLSSGNSIVIKTANEIYLVNLEDLIWQTAKNIVVRWSDQKTIPANLKQELLEYYRGKGLSLERVILDIHSGKIAGDWGLYLVDFMAILFILLSLSGTWMWFKRN